jgi:hypothetical protein
MTMLRKIRPLSRDLGILTLFFSSALLAADRPQSFKDLQARVDQRLSEWRPAADEKRFDRIGWCSSLLEAEKLAREHQRSIFLFTHDGRMNVGRC